VRPILGRNGSVGRIIAVAIPRRTVMLFLVFLCLALWFLGFMATTTLGGLLHILLVFAIVFFLVHIIQGRSIGEA
jgi:hypothetical protein